MDNVCVLRDEDSCFQGNMKQKVKTFPELSAADEEEI